MHAADVGERRFVTQGAYGADKCRVDAAGTRTATAAARTHPLSRRFPKRGARTAETATPPTQDSPAAVTHCRTTRFSLNRFKSPNGVVNDPMRLVTKPTDSPLPGSAQPPDPP
jgi:hypothetical protein